MHDLDLFAGRVLSADGMSTEHIRKRGRAARVEGQSAYHLTFPLEAGSYRIEVVGAAEQDPGVVYAEDVTILARSPPRGRGCLTSSSVFTPKRRMMPCSDRPIASRDHRAFHASSTEVTRKNEVSFFGFLVRPQESADGKVAIDSTIQLKRDGKRFGRPLDLPMDAIQVSDDVFVYANGISLGALPETGEYTMVFKVTDPGTETTVEREVEINVTE